MAAAIFLGMGGGISEISVDSWVIWKEVLRRSVKDDISEMIRPMSRCWIHEPCIRQWKTNITQTADLNLLINHSIAFCAGCNRRCLHIKVKKRSSTKSSSAFSVDVSCPRSRPLADSLKIVLEKGTKRGSNLHNS